MNTSESTTFSVSIPPCDLSFFNDLAKLRGWKTRTRATRKQKVSTNPDNPSPSGDPWFDDPENMAMLREAIAEAKKGGGTVFTKEERRKLLGL